ncbi:MAG: peptidoglycan DD-metalloendopeptidase family protein [Nannocystaceae bacterium]|nr:peptidoglycan DD-metalloendopeptidase family protein [Nannocystaceae bacterium]
MKRFEGTIIRLPVVTNVSTLEPLDGQLPRELPCIDFDRETGARIGTTCESAFRLARGEFNCPGFKLGTCHKHSFLYPRKCEGPNAIHRHQGVDIAKGKHGAPIVSVCSGVVERAARVYEYGVGGYGRTIVIRSNESGLDRWYLYAHCKTIDDAVQIGREVRAGQLIGTVGISDTKGKFIFDGTDESRSHLHFEVSGTRYWKDRFVDESNQDHFVPGADVPPKARLDPLAELARLGPWGTSRVFVPTTTPRKGASPDELLSARGYIPLDSEQVARFHSAVEASSTGGYFPLGANNDWHGGVHLSISSSRAVVAPFDAEIVAFRLDPDPVASLAEAGHTNFILLRHRISKAAARMFVGLPPVEEPGGKTKPKPPSVGRGGTNEPERILQVKSGLHARTLDGVPFYNPAQPKELVDPYPDEELYAAIEAFQASIKPPRSKAKKKAPPWPDGLMTVGGYTWISLFGPPPGNGQPKGNIDPSAPDGGDPASREPAKPAKPPQDEPTVFSLLMHLGARPLDADAVARFPWLGRTVLAPRDDDEAERAAAQRRADREADKAETHYSLTRRVGFPMVPKELDDLSEADVDPGAEADIRWVQQRLRRLAGYAGEADGRWVEEMRPVIQAFQIAHTKYFKRHPDEAEGFVMPKGQTFKALRRTVADLFGEADDPAVDDVLRLRATERDDVGRTRVVSGLAIPVKSGEPLWIPGLAEGATDSEARKDRLLEQVHWEIFAESNVTDWESIVDPDEDRTANLSPELYDAIEIGTLPGFAPDQHLVADEVREFYRSGRAEFLRQRVCKFRSEWNADIGEWVKTITELGFDPDDVASLLDAYRFWPAAADVLPPSSHVHHYNPIEFLGRYATILDTLRPPPSNPQQRQYAVLRARVVYADGQPWSYASVALALVGEGEQVRVTDVYGVVEFDGLEIGSAGMVWVVGEATSAHAFGIDGSLEEVVLEVDAAGPDVGSGSLRVTVRDPIGSPAGFVDVVLRDDAGFEVVAATGMDGEVVFTGLAAGEYQALARATPAVAFSLCAGEEQAIELLQLELGALQVSVRFQDGALADGWTVNASDGEQILEGVRAGYGVIAFTDVLPGDYVVYVPGRPESQVDASIDAGATAVVDVIVPRPEPRPPGGIIVTVRAPGGSPCAGARVVLLDDDNLQIDEGTTNGQGRVEFGDLEPGIYGASADHGKADELGIRVSSGESTHVDIELEGATGTLMVTVVYTDGGPVYGTLKVRTSGAVPVTSKSLQGSGDATFHGLDAGRYVVLLDGFEDHAVSVEVPAGGIVPVPLILPAPEG